MPPSRPRTRGPAPFRVVAMTLALGVVLAAAPRMVAQTTLLSDDFNGGSVNTTRWSAGSTGSLGVITVSGGQVGLDTNQQTTARAALLSHSTAVNPFAAPVTISLGGLALAGTPSGNPISLHVVVGHLPADSGGSASSSLAAAYTTGGGGYYTGGGTGGALGLSILRYGSGSIQLQVLDSGGVAGTGSYANALGSNQVISGVPTGLVWTIDGAAGTFSVKLTGATFTATGGTTASGSFSRFTEATLASSGGDVARLAIGAFNTGPSIIDGATATIGSVDVAGAGPSGPPVMMGVNLSAAGFGAQDPAALPGVHGQNYIYPSASHLDYYKARGIELIRFPFRWERIQKSLYAPLDAAELARLDTLLDQIEERGMHVILDLHNYGRYEISDVTYIIGSSQVPRAAYRDVWEKIAAHVGDWDCIWAYGIMNEPHSMGAHTWKDSAQEAIDGIREHDTRHAILVPGDAYSGAHWWTTHSADLINVTDPAGNLIFEAHQYFDSDNSGLYQSPYDADGAYPGIAVDRLDDFVEWCQANHVRGFIGEFGVPGNDSRWLDILDNAISYLSANNIAATYWAGGPWWGDYALSTEPRRAHDEAPQMTFLIPQGSGVGTRFWPAFTWYGDAFTVGPQGSYAYSYKSTTATSTVNFTDSGSANGNYQGAMGIRFDYTIPPGGWAGGGININGGAALEPNFDRAHVLTFQIKGSGGSSVRVFFRDTAGHLSAKVDTAAYTTTSGTWQEVRIPLAQFLNGSFDPALRVDRLAFEGLPADNTARLVQLDRFTIVKAEGQAPEVAVATAGGTTFATHAPFTATATATDASGIDFVEFLIDGQCVAIDDTAPYSAILSMDTPGQHRLTAIGYDMHGNPGRSTVASLTATP